MKLKHLLAGTSLAVLALTYASAANATRIQDCTGGSGDYGDAPASYGQACHDTNRWQQLGDGGTALPGRNSSGSNDINNPEWSAESAPRAVDTGDGGVQWATSVDGVNFTEFGRTEELVVGQFVQFQVDVLRADTGGHNFDQVKGWVDWFGEGTFDNAEVVFDNTWFKNEDVNDVPVSTGTSNGAVGVNSADTFRSFLSSAIQVPLTAALGDIWMRARLTCDFSFNNSNGNGLFATGYYHQGETEDYALRIVNGVTNVNAPGTALLLGAMIAGLLVRRQLSA